MKAMLLWYFSLVLNSKMRLEGCNHLLVLLIKENWYGGESFDSEVNLPLRALSHPDLSRVIEWPQHWRYQLLSESRSIFHPL